MNDPTELIRQMGQALVSGDVLTLERLWHPDYVFTAPVGLVLNRAQRLGFVAAGRRPLETLEYSDLEQHTYGETAVVIGTYQETTPGGLAGESGRITVVFARAGQLWQMVAGHNSRLEG